MKNLFRNFLFFIYICIWEYKYYFMAFLLAILFQELYLLELQPMEAIDLPFDSFKDHYKKKELVVANNWVYNAYSFDTLVYSQKLFFGYSLKCMVRTIFFISKEKKKDD